MLTDEHLRAGRHRDRVLQVTSHRQRRRHLPPEVHRQRRVATRPAHHQLAAQHHPNDRIVHVTDDRPIVHEEQIGDAAEPRDDLGFVDHHRLVGEVAAGADQRAADVRHQQVMQRRIRQHQAEQRASGGDVGGHRALTLESTPVEQDDGRFRRGEQARLRWREHAEGCRRRQVRAHDGERLLLAMLPRAESGHCGSVSGIHDQLEAAEPFHRHDASVAERRRRPRAALRRAAAFTRPSWSHKASCGPHTGQAFGCAWKRRSSGS